MTSPWKILVAPVVFVAAVSGCKDSGTQLVEAGGVVTYHGKPLSGATVTFIPDNAPPAMGTTDDQGAFYLVTRGQSGASVGTHKVSVILQQDQREIAPEEAQTMTTEELNRIRRSLIPTRYAHPRTSGLTETVTDQPGDNHFTIELRD